MSTPVHSPKITAVLGPTNTGKTYLAIERMLGHRTGMIGFPLRLLARENYDRVVGLVGERHVALVTGEEKIVPSSARYFLCTVESMPVARLVDFLGVDEIQLCADPERGHLFTDRLLRARGQAETMFLGSETIKPILRKLVPDAEFISRPRFSKLSYSGPKKLTRMKRRSAIVAFSANDVYALAEQIRRTSGGAAVVLGALSPRTRNAQVQMYQEGEVDYLVATDAIGMGLNMNIEHVAFWRLHKFDGLRRRPLAVDEIAQIAGRAGRYMEDGTFGTSAELGPLDPESVEAIENHRFQNIRGIWWRNSDLNFKNLTSLAKSLDEMPPSRVLRRVREAEDHRVLRLLAQDKSIAALAGNPDMVRLLWEVCQIPDFRKTMADVHVRLLGTIFRHLATADGRLPADWVADQLVRLERFDGDIDTLMARIAHTRTWTYVSHRSDWIDDAEGWQERARQIEDRLSDSLHERLTQRFVDRRSAVLVRSRGKETDADVSDDDRVFVEGVLVGRLEGLRFIPDKSAGSGDRRLLMAAAHRGLQREIARRVASIEQAKDDELVLSEEGVILWGEQKLGRLVRGVNILSPRPEVAISTILPAGLRDRVETRLTTWFNETVHRIFTPLVNLPDSKFSGAGRGLVFQLREGLGSVSRVSVREQIESLSADERKKLRSSGVRIGPQTIYIASLLKPRAVAMRALLWSVWHSEDVPGLPRPGLTTVSKEKDTNDAFFASIGFVTVGDYLVRADILDRVATNLLRLARAKSFDLPNEISSILGLGPAETKSLVRRLGYAVHPDGSVSRKHSKRHQQVKRGVKKKKLKRSVPGGMEDSPFAKLSELEL
ncbi:MAG: disulfide oxidoreductase [Rhodospirillaceae bacterium]|nr:disulfide oxidoreductase [Rhodospirillaceae bacterium]|tara:strand:- start:9144 stop:11639 length:2496 start_codon:yes stop_codon:yes gene_type:complete